jgi:hypothetical protein
VLGEHEATVSRKLGRIRRQLRAGTERALREKHRLGPAEIERCFELALDDRAFDLERTLVQTDG